MPVLETPVALRPSGRRKDSEVRAAVTRIAPPAPFPPASRPGHRNAGAGVTPPRRSLHSAGGHQRLPLLAPAAMQASRLPTRRRARQLRSGRSGTPSRLRGARRGAAGTLQPARPPSCDVRITPASALHPRPSRAPASEVRRPPPTATTGGRQAGPDLRVGRARGPGSLCFAPPAGPEICDLPSSRFRARTYTRSRQTQPFEPVGRVWKTQFRPIRPSRFRARRYSGSRQTWPREPMCHS